MKSNDEILNETGPRDGYFDSLKFVLITFVILGHTLEANLDNRLSLALYNTVYMFHMPLFIFVTGYFSRKYSDRKKQFRSLFMIFETLVVFQMIHNIRMAGTVGGAALILTPRWTMWYLYSVLAWKFFIYIMPDKLQKRPIIMITLSIIVSLVVGFIKIELLSFHRTCVFFPFFIMGYYCNGYSIDVKHQVKRLSPFVIIPFLGIVLVLLYKLNIPLFQLVSGKKPYNFFEQTEIVSMMLRCMHLIVATFMSICVMTLMKDFCSKTMRRIGADTLFFYMIHSFIVLLTRQVFITFDIQFNILTMLLLFLLNYAIVYVLSIIPYSHFILNPISKLINKKI